MMLIAGGFLVLSFSAVQVSFWVLPILMLPISIGTNVFNPVNNATVMNSLALEHRGVASGMRETTREIGHAFGATAAAGILALSLPAGIDLLTGVSAQSFYREGFQISSLMVVFVLSFGATLAYLHKAPVLAGAPPARPSATTYQPGGEGSTPAHGLVSLPELAALIKHVPLPGLLWLFLPYDRQARALPSA